MASGSRSSLWKTLLLFAIRTPCATLCCFCCNVPRAGFVASHATAPIASCRLSSTRLLDEPLLQHSSSHPSLDSMPVNMPDGDTHCSCLAAFMLCRGSRRDSRLLDDERIAEAFVALCLHLSKSPATSIVAMLATILQHDIATLVVSQVHAQRDRVQIVVIATTPLAPVFVPMLLLLRQSWGISPLILGWRVHGERRGVAFFSIQTPCTT